MKILSKQSAIPNNFIEASEKLFSGNSGSHIHEFFEIEYILSGSGICEIDGVSYPLEPHMLFLLNPANTHALYAENTRLINVMFRCARSRDIVPLPLIDPDTSPVFRLADRDSTLIGSLLSEIVAVHKSDLSYALLLLECLLKKLSHFSAAEDRLPLPYIRYAFLYVTEHFRDGITLESTAAHIGLTPTYFSDLFKKETGMGFKAYLDRVRFSHAESLLAFTDLPISEIPRSAGFYDYANFSRRFRQQLGMSPSEYRARHRLK